MQYVPPLGAEDPNASYSNGNALAGVRGSIVDGRAIEHTQREIIAVIEAAGLTPEGEDLTQLVDAIVAIVASSSVPAATDTAPGIVELATNAEVETGTDTERAVTPAGLASLSATEALKGLVELATAAEALGGTDALRAVTSAGLASAQVLGDNAGYIKFPGGLILQWGAVTIPASGNGTFTYPVSFPVGAFRAIAATSNSNSFASISSTPGNSSTAVYLRNTSNVGVAGSLIIFILGR